MFSLRDYKPKHILYVCSVVTSRPIVLKELTNEPDASALHHIWVYALNMNEAIGICHRACWSKEVIIQDFRIDRAIVLNPQQEERPSGIILPPADYE